MTAHRAARSVLESDLAAAAAGYGLEAVRSVDAFPTMFTGETRPSNEEMLAKAKASGCDAIFTLSLLDVKSEQRYVEGTTTGGYTPHFDYYGRFTGYWTHTYPVVATPGYYVTDETYFVEANLFDVATEKILWSMQSAAYNPKDINDFSKKYTKLLVERLEEENKTAGTK
jgi:hypothetical protein